MNDQAQGLRVLARHARGSSELEDTAVISPRTAARTIAITSGKGGVGKTNFTTNLALLLAQTGQRVIVLDADLGLANLHFVLGVSPKFHLEHVIRGEKTIKEILYPAANGIQIIAGGTGIAELANLTNERRERFIDGLAELDAMADVILIDTGAGLSNNVLGFLLASEEVIVITTPEPTAIADAYATIKVVSRDNAEANIRLVVNMANSELEAHAAGERLRLVSKQFLDIEIEVLGHIPTDTAIPKAVRAQKPVVLNDPTSPATRAIGRIADKLGFTGSVARPAGIGGFLNRVARYFGSR